MVRLSVDGNLVKNGQEELVGLSTEAKPVNIADGSTFLELDTGNVFMALGNAWYPL